MERERESVCVCVCVCMSLYVCVCLFVYVCMWVCVCLSLCVYASMCLCVCVCVCVCDHEVKSKHNSLTYKRNVLKWQIGFTSSNRQMGALCTKHGHSVSVFLFMLKFPKFPKFRHVPFRSVYGTKLS